MPQRQFRGRFNGETYSGINPDALGVSDGTQLCGACTGRGIRRALIAALTNSATAMSAMPRKSWLPNSARPSCVPISA